MTEKDMKKNWYTTGSKFGITKDRQIEIFEDIKEKLEESALIGAVEIHIAKTYHSPGEAYIAGFALCYIMASQRMQEESGVRQLFWDFLLGIKRGPIDPFASSFPVQLIEATALKMDPTEGIRRSLEDYKKFQEKRERKPEVA